MTPVKAVHNGRVTPPKPKPKPKPKPQLSLETLNLLCEVLAQVTIQANQDDFDDASRRVGNARRELLSAVAAHPDARPNQMNKEQ